MEENQKKRENLHLNENHRWVFKANNIKAVSASKRDDRLIGNQTYTKEITSIKQVHVPVRL